MIKFETDRLSIREFEDSDFDNLYSLLSNPTVMKYCLGPLNKEETQTWLDGVMRYYKQYGYDYWVAIDKNSGEFIGQIGIIKQKVENKWIDCIAFMIRQDKWGYGYGTEGAKGCMKFGIEKLGLKELYATVEVGNDASKSILNKIGMKYKKEVECFNHNVLLYVL